MNTHQWIQALEGKLGLGTDKSSDRKRRILRHVSERTVVSRDVHHEMQQQETYGQRLADRVAEFGGSWTFIMIFVGILLVWTISNVLLLTQTYIFDPYPFVFLNLMLSMVAALQAPIIMMSQNRQGAKDRAAAQHDYEVNLKAELEIMALHEKLDHVKIEQLEKMMQKQDEQIKLLSKLVQGQTGS